MTDPDYYFPQPARERTYRFQAERTEVRYNPDGAALLQEFCRGFLTILLPFIFRRP